MHVAKFNLCLQSKETDATFGGQAGRQASIIPVNLRGNVLKQQNWVAHSDAVLMMLPWHLDFFMLPVSGGSGKRVLWLQLSLASVVCRSC